MPHHPICLRFTLEWRTPAPCNVLPLRSSLLARSGSPLGHSPQDGPRGLVVLQADRTCLFSPPWVAHCLFCLPHFITLRRVPLTGPAAGETPCQTAWRGVPGAWAGGWGRLLARRSWKHAEGGAAFLWSWTVLGRGGRPAVLTYLRVLPAPSGSLSAHLELTHVAPALSGIGLRKWALLPTILTRECARRPKPRPIMHRVPSPS